MSRNNNIYRENLVTTRWKWWNVRIVQLGSRTGCRDDGVVVSYKRMYVKKTEYITEVRCVNVLIYHEMKSLVKRSDDQWQDRLPC